MTLLDPEIFCHWAASTQNLPMFARRSLFESEEKRDGTIAYCTYCTGTATYMDSERTEGE